MGKSDLIVVSSCNSKRYFFLIFKYFSATHSLVSINLKPSCKSFSLLIKNLTFAIVATKSSFTIKGYPNVSIALSISVDSFTEMNGTTLVPALLMFLFQLSGLVITV